MFVAIIIGDRERAGKRKRSIQSRHRPRKRMIR
jgi:hypothetical protein